MKKVLHIKRVETIRHLSCELTIDEIVDMASESAELEQRMRILDEEMKEKAQEFKGKIKTAEGQVMRLSACIRSRSEERPVKCEQRFDYDEGVVRTIRLDTAEELDCRQLSEEEKQIEMDLDPEPPKKDKPEKKKKKAAKKTEEPELEAPQPEPEAKAEEDPDPNEVIQDVLESTPSGSLEDDMSDPDFE